MQTLALDVGSHSVRGGLAGQDQPRTVETSAVGVSGGDIVFPCKFGTRRTKTHVVDMYEAIFDTKKKTTTNPYLDVVLDTILFPTNGNVSRHSTPVVFSYPGDRKFDRKFSTKKYVQAMVSSLFEYAEVPAVYARPDAVLAAFACGRTSAVVADFGATQTTMARISEGAVSEISSWKFGGTEFDALVMKRLAAENGGKFPNIHDDVEESYLRRSQLHVIQEMKQSFFRVSPLTLSPPPERMRAAKKQGNTIMYKLPDNTEIDVATVYEYMPELYFSPRVLEKFHVPDFPGVAQALAPHFQTTEAESLFGEPLSPERAPTQPLVLCGGVAQMTGFQARVQAEIPQHVPVLCPAMFGRPYASWTGASVLGSLAACAGNLAISSKEYLDQGLDRVVDLLISS